MLESLAIKNHRIREIFKMRWHDCLSYDAPPYGGLSWGRLSRARQNLTIDIRPSSFLIPVKDSLLRSLNKKNNASLEEREKNGWQVTAAIDFVLSYIESLNCGSGLRFLQPIVIENRNQ